jgi:hypothetical protein
MMPGAAKLAFAAVTLTSCLSFSSSASKAQSALDALHGGGAKTANFSSMSVGNCGLANGVLVLWNDGTALWTAEVWTNHTHTKDVWHLTFYILDGPEQRWVNISDKLDGPAMSDGNGGPPPHYNWRTGFQYDSRARNAGNIHVSMEC